MAGPVERISDHDFVVPLALRAVQNECRKVAKLGGNALADYVAKGSKTALPPFPLSYPKAMCGPTVTWAMQEITPHLGRLFKTLGKAWT